MAHRDAGKHIALVKEFLLATAVQGIHGALAAGSLARETVEARLEPRDLALLDEKLDPIPPFEPLAAGSGLIGQEAFP